MSAELAHERIGSVAEVEPEGATGERWAFEQVVALAPKQSAVAPALALAVPSRWTGLGCDGRAVWGRHHGASSEPYEVIVDHVDVAVGCSCPSRATPCKHALGLLVLWSRGQVPAVDRPAWLARGRVRRIAGADVASPTTVTSHAPLPAGDGRVDVVHDRPADREELPGSADSADRDRQRDERVARMAAGLVELDRWVLDRLRAGLADPALARPSTWESVAARLVDAQVPGLANRVRRIGARVGLGPAWHEHLLADLGTLHLLASAGLRHRELPGPLADGVATALGWQVRQADVLAGVPVSDSWVVAGYSDVREDRIEVRRTWLWGRRTREWAMVLSFAAYGQSLDESMRVGTVIDADVYRYPGAVPLRALVGLRCSTEPTDEAPESTTVAGACDAVGRVLAAEPWVERVPFTVRAGVAAADDRHARDARRWLLTDHTGSLPLDAGGADLAVLVTAAATAPVVVTCEWTAFGILPLTVHLADRSLPVGPDHQRRAA